MIRIIIRVDDSAAVVNGGAALAHTSYRTIDIEAPEVEKFITTSANGYEQKQVVGIELRAAQKPDPLDKEIEEVYGLQTPDLFMAFDGNCVIAHSTDKAAMERAAKRYQQQGRVVRYVAVKD